MKPPNTVSGLPPPKLTLSVGIYTQLEINKAASLAGIKSGHARRLCICSGDMLAYCASLAACTCKQFGSARSDFNPLRRARAAASKMFVYSSHSDVFSCLLQSWAGMATPDDASDSCTASLALGGMQKELQTALPKICAGKQSTAGSFFLRSTAIRRGFLKTCL